MNQILSEVPNVSSHYYAPCAPKWLNYIVRTLFILAGIIITVLSISDWDTMPLGFRILVCVLVPAFFLIALYSKIWTQQPYFLANHSGMYFRPSGSLVIGQAPRKLWLFVPWKNISNIRVAKIMSGDTSKGAAFDVKASHEEVAEFFHHYGYPEDKNQSQVNGMAVVFYDNYPPSPSTIVSDLLELTNHRDTNYSAESA
jgi:hypothetical protein